jgi:rod shape-determining protein MreD
VKTVHIVIALALPFCLQLAIRNLMVLGTAPLDLVLVAVVYVALTWGPTTGLLAGASAGLAQDALGSGIIGIGGLAKTVVGYIVGQAGTQFIVSGPLPRFVTFVASTIIHAVIFMGLNELLGLAHFGFPWGGVLGQGVANAVVGIVILQAIELLPGAIERRQEKAGGEFRASRRLD